MVGLGRIANHFIEALAVSATCRVTALVSGSPKKARRLATKFNVRHILAYADYDRLRNLPEVDAVYLALPVSMHREYTERAAAAGKHVLCEKPMASTSADAAAMVEACRAANVLLSIAYRCPHTVVHQRARDLVRGGALGPKQTLRIRSEFGFRLGKDWRADPALAGGGSLFDVGIYPLNAARYLLEENPIGAQVANATHNAHGLEQSIAWTSVFPSGARAECKSSYVEDLPDTLCITGKRGTLLLSPAFSHRKLLQLTAHYTSATGEKIEVTERTPRHALSQFRLEAEHLADAACTEAELITPGEYGLADMIAMNGIYDAADRRERGT